MINSSNKEQNMNKRALIVVDIQNDYFPGGKWTLNGVEAAADNAVKLIGSARVAGNPVIHVRHEFKTADAPFFAPDSHGALIHPKIEIIDNEPVVLKHYINSFRETNLKALLDSKAIEEVVICGAMSHMCIDAITRASNDFGYKVTVIHDACATLDLEFNGVQVPAAHVHAAFMAALGFAYAKMYSTDEYLSLAELQNLSK
jgi:nicotinamidase-related amidase